MVMGLIGVINRNLAGSDRGREFEQGQWLNGLQNTIRHRVKVAPNLQAIDSKVVISRKSRQNLFNRRYLLPNCYQIYNQWVRVDRGGSALTLFRNRAENALDKIL